MGEKVIRFPAEMIGLLTYKEINCLINCFILLVTNQKARKNSA